jgi:hypothetical protein
LWAIKLSEQQSKTWRSLEKEAAGFQMNADSLDNTITALVRDFVADLVQEPLVFFFPPGTREIWLGTHRARSLQSEPHKLREANFNASVETRGQAHRGCLSQ